MYRYLCFINIFLLHILFILYFIIFFKLIYILLNHVCYVANDRCNQMIGNDKVENLARVCDGNSFLFLHAWNLVFLNFI